MLLNSALVRSVLTCTEHAGVRYALAAVNGQLSAGANATDMRARVARATDVTNRAGASSVLSEMALALRRRPGAGHRYATVLGVRRSTPLMSSRGRSQFGFNRFRGGALASSTTKSTVTSVARYATSISDLQHQRRLGDAIDEPAGRGQSDGQQRYSYKMPLIQFEDYPSISDPQVKMLCQVRG